MLVSYVWRDLVRNPRRTLAALAGVTLGVGLFSAVLFFIDGSGASMTKRAIAPLALDMQRVLDAPVGGGLRLEEQLSARSTLHAGQTTTITLTLRNASPVPATEVVVSDEPPPPLAYVRGSTLRDGRPLRDGGGQSPLAQGLARVGRNLGTLAPHATMTITYRVRARQAIADVRRLRLAATVSSSENLAPIHANAPAPLTTEQMRARMARTAGVAHVDELAFVDLPPGSLQVGPVTVARPVRVFGFDTGYQRHHPTIRVTTGALRPGSAVLSVEAARALRARPGAAVRVRLPGARAPLSLPVAGVADLSAARPLFYSRKSSNLEDFVYVPDSIIVSGATFRQAIIPAFRFAAARSGAAIKELPLVELDVTVARSALRADPGAALAQTKAVARSIERVAPGQGHLIDNISNTLEVARADGAVAKRMFLFLGLPGALMAAFLAAYAGSVLAAAQRREQAMLRIRGAHRGHLLRLLTYRTLALAGAGALAGTAVGLLSAIVALGWGSLREAASGQLALSAAIAAGVGMTSTALALYLPGRRALAREITGERAELAQTRTPRWRMMRLDALVLAAVAVGEALAVRAGAFDPSPGSVYEGRAVSLPTYLLIGPVLVWLAGVLLAVRGFETAAARVPRPAARYGPAVRGTLGRSLRRRPAALTTGVLALGLVVALATGLAMFAATYDAGKASDARFAVGSDLRVTPSVSSTRPHPAALARRLQVRGVAAATPVLAGMENAVLTGPYTQDHENLAAIEPRSFRRVAALSDRFFEGGSAAAAMSALQADPRGLLVNARVADALQVGVGDRVEVLLSRGTKRQTLVKLHVVGLFRRFPGFPQGIDLVADLGYYAKATGTDNVDYFLARSADRGSAGLAGAVARLRAGPGRRDRLNIETTRTALDKDQSSLTAVNVHGLLGLDRFYALMMAAAGLAILVFGLLLQRRREYVALRAQGMSVREIYALVLGEIAPVAIYGLASGLLVGVATGWLLVRVLRPLFILDPGPTVAVADLGGLAALILGAALASTLAATVLLRRLRPTEILREG